MAKSSQKFAWRVSTWRVVASIGSVIVPNFAGNQLTNSIGRISSIKCFAVSLIETNSIDIPFTKTPLEVGAAVQPTCDIRRGFSGDLMFPSR